MTVGRTTLRDNRECPLITVSGSFQRRKKGWEIVEFSKTEKRRVSGCPREVKPVSSSRNGPRDERREWMSQEE